jgi:hypothetical protein
MFRVPGYTAIALAAALTACDRPVPTAPHDETVSIPTAAPLSSQQAAERSAMDRLARRMARALDDAGFRAYVKGKLEQSLAVEHKLHFQAFLESSNRLAIRELARLNGQPESDIVADARESIPLEMYFPVRAHRAAWSGGPDILVASAREDREAPVGYDVKGRRRVLSPDAAPAIPVLAMVPVETDFGTEKAVASEVAPAPPPLPPPPAPTPPAGLYMTYAKFVQDFEGWFKGDPEFELHILGQSGATDSLTDYQCAGARAGGYYWFDQNSTSWSGRVLLFSQAQLNSYKTAHPNQNFRIIALEDDDTGCVIKFDSNRFKNLQSTLQAAYPDLTGSKDTVSSTLAKIIKRANALQKILRSAYSFITTQDDLIGNAVEDVVVGQFYPGANWIVKGEKNVTNGWIKLEMR